MLVLCRVHLSHKVPWHSRLPTNTCCWPPRAAAWTGFCERRCRSAHVRTAQDSRLRETTYEAEEKHTKIRARSTGSNQLGSLTSLTSSPVPGTGIGLRNESGGWVRSPPNGGMGLLVASKLESWDAGIAGQVSPNWIWSLALMSQSGKEKAEFNLWDTACVVFITAWGLPSSGPAKSPSDCSGCEGQGQMRFPRWSWKRFPDGGGG